MAAIEAIRLPVMLVLSACVAVLVVAVLRAAAIHAAAIGAAARRAGRVHTQGEYIGGASGAGRPRDIRTGTRATNSRS